jgi:CheY-like chemotaxis protein
MNAIIGFTKVLLKSDLNEKQKEYLNAIKLSGDALTVLINDILDLAKVDAGKMVFEQTPFKMAASISAMIHLFEKKIQEKNLQLIKKYDDKIPKVLSGDPVRLHQIILNLISNAVKFTSEGKITISTMLLNEDEEKADIEFSVSDTGIGIPEDKMEHIFENFQQATSETARLYGGTGLGLAISKQLVESQGGRIIAKSKLGEGSTFSFILPFQKTDAEVELEKVMNVLTTRIQNVKVLVVEDIALNQLLMKTLLDDFGFEHDIAENGKIAIEKLQNISYDIILMDLHMPEMNGFEATEYIRGTMNSKIPIIALTADVTTADLNKCKAVGMDDYISKPLDENVLFNKISDLLIKHKLIPDRSLPTGISKYVDLTFLKKRTKDNPELIAEMIELYLKQTPPLIKQLKLGLNDKDWSSVYTAAHKLIPSFSIMGIHQDFEDAAKKIQEYSGTQQHLGEIPELVTKVENACSGACKELEGKINIKKSK